MRYGGEVSGGESGHAPVELLPVLLRLQELPVCRGVVVLEVRLNGLVLLVELGEVGHEVLNNVHCASQHSPFQSSVSEQLGDMETYYGEEGRFWYPCSRFCQSCRGTPACFDH